MKIAGAWPLHDCSYCILEDGVPIIHDEYERFVREKEPAGDALKFLFENFEDTSDIVHLGLIHPISSTEKYRSSYQRMASIIEKNGGAIHAVGHHEAHAANAFFSSHFDKSIILILDGGGTEDDQGTRTAASIWLGENNKIKAEKIYPISEYNIGRVWSQVTRWIFRMSTEWPKGSKAGTIMAMAAFGNPDRFSKDFERMFGDDFDKVDVNPVGTPPRSLNRGPDPDHPFLQQWEQLMHGDDQCAFDIAAGLQAATEKVISSLIGQLITRYPDYNNICLSGGVSLNSVSIGKIRTWSEGKITGIFVPPTPHDGGLSIGAAQFVWHQILDHPRVVRTGNFSPYLGKTYSRAEVLEAIDSFQSHIEAQECSVESLVGLLEDQKIISIFGGGSESGKRALGNRSIIADPRRESIKHLINEKVKHREWFRPFAPSILREKVSEYFDQDVSVPYMEMVLPIREEMRSQVMGIVHEDGTARLQTVQADDNPFYHRLLTTWYQRTGVPILLNTSFNDREPICELPCDAINCFLGTNIDYLYFSDHQILLKRIESGSCFTRRILPGRKIPFGQLKENVLNEDALLQFSKEGYLIVPQIIDSKACNTLKNALTDAINKVMFEMKGEAYRLNPKFPKSYSILTHTELRKSQIKTPNLFWEGDNELIKTENGMGPGANFYFLPEKEVLISGNPKIYNVYRQILGQTEFLLEPERMGIKAEGATDMPRHLDINLFGGEIEETEVSIHENPLNPGDRLQGMVCVDIDEDEAASTSGTLTVIPGFHQYFELARIFFHYENGFPPCRLPKSFHMPQSLESGAFRLDIFNEFIRCYTKLRQGQRITSKTTENKALAEFALAVHRKFDISVPEQARELEWHAVPLKPGDLIVWDATLPHASLRNKSKNNIPRMVAYIDMRPIRPDIYSTKLFDDRKAEIRRLEMGVHGGPNQKNHLEIALAKYYSNGTYDHFYTEQGLYDVPRDNLLLRALMGFDAKTGQNFTWDDYRNMGSTKSNENLQTEAQANLQGQT